MNMYRGPQTGQDSLSSSAYHVQGDQPREGGFLLTTAASSGAQLSARQDAQAIRTRVAPLCVLGTAGAQTRAGVFYGPELGAAAAVARAASSPMS